MTYREQILEVVKVLEKPDFTAREVIQLMEAAGSRYSRWTIRTHIASLCRAGASVHHSAHYDDFERVGRGLYRLRPKEAGFRGWYIKQVQA